MGVVLPLKGTFLRVLPLKSHQRGLFYWINLQFNAVSEDRIQKFGADRVCAEWILRNGGKVRCVGQTDFLHDYNALPKEGVTLSLEEVDASDSSVMHNGFEHFKNCNFISKVTLHRCNYLEERALPKLNYLTKSLRDLILSSCGNIGDQGVASLGCLKKLRNLILKDLNNVKNMQKTVELLQGDLPNCNIQYK